MYFPIRCFTTGIPIGHLWEEYQEKLKTGMTPKEALDEMDIDLFATRRMFLSHVDIMDKVNKYSKL